jgi:glutaryl-CoA dehydrogenase
MAPATATTAIAKPTTQTKAPKPLPAPNSDFYEICETLSAEELATVKRVRAFMEAKVAPVITKYWVDDAFPSSCCRRERTGHWRTCNAVRLRRGSLALLGFVQMELPHRPSFSTFVSVTWAAMGSIYIDGSKSETSGCRRWRASRRSFFGLPGPLVGSGASGGL